MIYKTIEEKILEKAVNRIILLIFTQTKQIQIFFFL